jgi:PPM family protein phosphatase
MTTGPTNEPNTKSDETAPPQKGQIIVRLFGRTDVGQIREHNEDNFIVADLTRKSRGLMESDRVQTVDERGTLLGVCDGMGGAAAGEIASQLAVDIIYESMANGDMPKDRDSLARRIVHSIETAGSRIYQEAKADRSRRGMGTTSTVAALLDDHLFFGQVGDSRAYILRGGRMVQVTRDQSLVNQLIEAGQLTEEEAETFEHNNIILQALGTSDTVQVDLTFVQLRKGDVLLLCSDGLSGMVKLEEMREVLNNTPDPLEACKILTERANQAGGHDNITCIVAQFEGDGLEAPRDDDPELKYRKYILPEDANHSIHDEPTIRNIVEPLDLNKNSNQQDTGASYRKLNSTMVDPNFSLEDVLKQIPGESGNGSDPGHRSNKPRHSMDDDPPVIPVENTPMWMIVGLLGMLVAFVIILGYFLLK